MKARNEPVSGSEIRGKCIVCDEDCDGQGFRSFTGECNWWWLCDWHFKQTAKYPSIPAKLKQKRNE